MILWIVIMCCVFCLFVKFQADIIEGQLKFVGEFQSLSFHRRMGFTRFWGALFAHPNPCLYSFVEFDSIGNTCILSSYNGILSWEFFKKLVEFLKPITTTHPSHPIQTLGISRHHIMLLSSRIDVPIR